MTVRSRVGLKVVEQVTWPFFQTLCFAIALLFAREFTRERRDPVEYYPQLPESQEQAELSLPEVEGWSHLGLIGGILVGPHCCGVSLAVFVGLKHCHLGSARSFQLANEVSVTNGGDSEPEACSPSRKTTAGLEGCWCREIAGLCVRLVLVATLGHRSHLEESI